MRDISLRDWLTRWCLGLLFLIQLFAGLGLYGLVDRILWSKAYSYQLDTVQGFWANRPPIMDGETPPPGVTALIQSELDSVSEPLGSLISTLLRKQLKETESGGNRNFLSFRIWGPVMAEVTSALAKCSGSRLYSDDGSLVYSVGAANPLPTMNSDEVRQFISQGPTQARLDPSGEYYVLYFPLVSHGHAIGLLQSANSAAPIRKQLQTLAAIILFSNSLALAIGYFILLWISRALAAPLDSLMQATKSVASGNLDARTGLAYSRNEIFALGSAFDQMAERLQSSFAAQNRFIADASHELKTPLTTLSGMAEVLQLDSQLQNEKSAKAVQVIVSQVERMNELVSDLLVLSQAVETTQHDHLALNLSGVLEELVDEASMRFSESHRLVCECPVEGLSVIGPEGRLRRLFGNILDNALQYTPAGGTVSIRAAVHGTQARVEICDTGQGISHDDLPQLCERFFRADRSRARRTGGTGLGLAIVKAMVVALNGKLEISSRLGEGTQVTVFLPLVDEQPGPLRSEGT